MKIELTDREVATLRAAVEDAIADCNRQIAYEQVHKNTAREQAVKDVRSDLESIRGKLA